MYKQREREKNAVNTTKYICTTVPCTAKQKHKHFNDKNRYLLQPSGKKFLPYIHVPLLYKFLKSNVIME